MKRIWRYVLAADNGMAPCIDDGMLSLCCCKPVIRRNANEGDWVVGFLPKRFGRGLVAWAGCISEVLSLGEYQQRFSARCDAIYQLDENSPLGPIETLIPLRDDYHADPKSRQRDWRGKNALLFEPFWYFGGRGVEAPPEIADLAHYFVGQSATRSSPENVETLVSWLSSLCSSGVNGTPRDKASY